MARNLFATGLDCSFYCMFHTSAARHFHSDNSNALDVVILDDSRQLFGVITLVKLRTTDKRNSVTDKLIVEIAVTISSTIGSNEKVRLVKIRCIYRGKFNLNWEIGKLAFHGRCKIRTGTAAGRGAETPDRGGIRDIFLAFCYGDGYNKKVGRAYDPAEQIRIIFRIIGVAAGS